MAKLDYECFYGDFVSIGFNAAKYTKEQALKIAEKELELDENELSIEPAYIYYGFGVDEDGERRNGYWLEIGDVPRGNAFKAWAVQRSF